MRGAYTEGLGKFGKHAYIPTHNFPLSRHKQFFS